MSVEEVEGVRDAIRRIWTAGPEDQSSLAEDAYVLLDLATSLRRESEGLEWATARLLEGFARLFVARQTASWGHRSYTIQALEASLDGLRDAAASLPADFEPNPEDIIAFRSALMVHWRAVQSEPDLQRIAMLDLRSLRTPC